MKHNSNKIILGLIGASFLASSYSIPIPVQANILTNVQAYYKLENVNDSTSNARTLTNTGSATFVAAKIDNGVQSGTGKDLERLTDAYGLTSAGDYCWNLWTKFSAITSGDIFRHHTNSGGNRDTILYIPSANTVNMYASGNEVSATSLSTGVWYMWTISKSGTTFTFYKNGVSLGTATQGISGASLNQLSVAGDVGGVTPIITGIVDEFLLRSATCSQAEINDLYNYGLALRYPLVNFRLWPFYPF